MSKRNRKNISFSNFGFSTILLAFVMICIVTISAISLLTANSDYNLSKKVAEKNFDYYHAEGVAYEKLAEIDTNLAKAYKKSSSAHTYYLYAEQTLSTLEYGSYNKDATKHYYSYEIPISEGHTLSIELEIHYPNSANDTFYKITKWQSVYETTMHEEETLNLMQ